ncbi:zinc finger protein 831 [Nannospalax galili]|uniref:zinc finger protein 831 n=1 Tax=Nannospalax galili TaxID=1026970 RepID=UPI0004ED0F8E|nr:zinc finger protein 831 [Nannospalax galili]
MQAPGLSYPTVPGTRVQDPVSSAQWKKGTCHRKVKTAHGNSRKKLRIQSKRCEGSFWQSRAQLRTKRLYKPPWMPRRSCLPHRLEGLEPRRTLRRASSEAAGLSVPGDPSCTGTELSTGHGSGRREEDSSRWISEPSCPTTSPETSRETERSTLEDNSSSAGEHNDRSQEKDPADGSELSLQSNRCLVVAKEDLPSQGKGLDVGLLGMRPLPSQDQVSIDPKLCISPDVLEPSSFGPKGTFACPDTAPSVAAIFVSAGMRALHTRLGGDSAESCTPQTLAEGSPESRDVAKSRAQARLPGRPSPRQRSPGKSHLEIPASRPSSPTSNQEEEKLQVDFPSRSQYGSRDVVIQCSVSGQESGMGRTSGLITLKGHAALSDQEPSEVPEAPLRSIRKRSLEGMRKQTRVELSDTSSDDEDRLVIEI